MVENVTQALENRAPSLLEKLVTNADLCNFVLGLLGRLLIESSKKAKPFEGITISALSHHDLSNGDLELRATVAFNDLTLSIPAVWPIQSDFAQYVRARAHGLGLALQKNPGLCSFFQNVIESLERFGKQKSIPFASLVVRQDRPYGLTPDNVLTFSIGRKILNG